MSGRVGREGRRVNGEGVFREDLRGKRSLWSKKVLNSYDLSDKLQLE